MATIILKSNEVVHALVLFSILLLLVHKGDAYDFVVGGQKGWSVPSDPNSNPYNQWAQKSRFQIGDSLVFNYPSGQDSVIQVSSQDYANCNTDAYSQKFSDGHTIIKLNRSGPHFFISGNKNNCLKNEKLVVIVLADRNNRNTNTASPSPSPSPSVTTKSLAPSPAPSQKEVQSPVAAPAQQEAPSPPSPVTNTTPAPAPASDQTPASPHKSNAASSIFVSFAGSVGAFLVTVLVASF
ncbi:early nodulin-like protein 3 [Cajanus cajan]|uniref:Early nodulin-like protein 3 n=1 Tax=Cajanus cajan TaxID=3821 RepID=A0A151RE26_CAJCA|nr:early nodulin-like protein 3 [Cajanus cajan]KYP40729.1 Early nodulin-like protein 3 [Cajanus cajan]